MDNWLEGNEESWISEQDKGQKEGDEGKWEGENTYNFTAHRHTHIAKMMRMKCNWQKMMMVWIRFQIHAQTHMLLWYALMRYGSSRCSIAYALPAVSLSIFCACILEWIDSCREIGNYSSRSQTWFFFSCNFYQNIFYLLKLQAHFLQTASQKWISWSRKKNLI